MPRRIPYTIDQSVCTFCGGCAAVCPAQAILVHDARIEINESCTQCGTCAKFCPVDAIACEEEADA